MEEKVTQDASRVPPPSMLIGTKAIYPMITAFITVVTVARSLTTSLESVPDVLGNTAWYSAILSGALGAALFGLSCIFMARHKGKSLDIALKDTLGNVLGGLALMILCVLFLEDAVFASRGLGGSVSAYILQSTPSWLLCVIVAFIAAVCCAHGIEHVTRFAYLIRIPLFIIVITIPIIAKQNLNYLFPIGGYGFGRVLNSSLKSVGAFLPVIAIWLLPRTDYEMTRKAGFMAILFSTVITSGLLLCHAAATPMSDLQELTAIGELIGLIFARVSVLPPLYIFLWGSAYLFMIVHSLYFATRSASAALNCEYRPVIIVMALLLPVISLIPGRDWPLWFPYARLLYILPIIPALFRRVKNET